MNTWLKIDKFGPFMPLITPFLLMDEYGSINVGFTAFDYYDAEYWHPLPEMPKDNNGIITNDAFIENMRRKNEML